MSHDGARGVARNVAMETTSLADAKNRLSELVSAVQGTWEQVTITKNGKPVAVLPEWASASTASS
jgi:prevent-host-death family protein